MSDSERLQEYLVILQECVAGEERDSSKSLPNLLKNPDFLKQLAEALLDGVMFEIIDSLRELQLMTEANLHSKRDEVLKEQTKRKQKFQEDSEQLLGGSDGHSKQSSLQQHAQMLQGLDRQLTNELKNFDVKIIEEMDKRLADQQSTLQRAGLPGFVCSEESSDVTFQMQIMRIVTRFEHRIGRLH